MRYFMIGLSLMLATAAAGTLLAAEDSQPVDEAIESATALEEVEKDKKGRGGKGKKAGRRGQGPPKPEELFEKFDANGDNQLSREEFMQLSEFMREHHARKRPGPRGERGERPGRNFGRRDGDRPGPPPPPPREGRREFRSPPPLRNPGNQSGPPPGERFGRRGDGERPSFRGREGGPPEGRRPDPNRIFDHFDRNQDDQLSREEFLVLAERMREMRERHGDRGGRGFDRDRPGPPRRGGPPREGRPPRGERERGADLGPPVQDDSSV